MEKKALGRGLQALLPEKKVEGWRVGQEAHAIPMEKIIPNRNQPRKLFRESDLKELAESLKEHGMLHPVLVRRTGDGAYELIAGERRWRAANLAGLSTIPAVIRVTSDEKSLALGLVENIQRQNLNPMEESRGYSRLMSEFGFTQDQVAHAIGKDRSTVANFSRLVSLPTEIQKFIESEQLTFGHAKVVAGVQDREDQLKIASKIVQDQLSVRQTERLVLELGKKKRPPTRKAEARPYAEVEERMRKRLGTKADVRKSRRGGQIVIHFFSEDELDRILELLLE